MQTEWWSVTPLAERRRILEEADLWDGNTYALRAWEEFPIHIRIALQATQNDRIRRGVANAQN